MQSASSHGIIMPMLIIQIQGYIVGSVLFAFVVINDIFLFSKYSVPVSMITFCIHAFVVFLISVITGFVSYKRK